MRCSFEGAVIRPDGVHELDPCVYETAELHTNVTVEVLRCIRCGHIMLMWHRQADTEDIITGGGADG